MPAYNTPAALYKQASPGHGFGGNVKAAFTEIEVTAALTTADTFDFFTLPAGSRVLFAMLEASDLDTNVSPLLTLNVGDAGSATRYFSASTVGQAGTAATATAATGILHKYTTATKITGTVQANAATGVAGTVRLLVLYTID